MIFIVVFVVIFVLVFVVFVVVFIIVRYLMSLVFKGFGRCLERGFLGFENWAKSLDFGERGLV